MNTEELEEPKKTIMAPPEDDDSDEPEQLKDSAHTPEANAKRDAHPNWRNKILTSEELFERREFVYTLRKRGFTWREIGEEVGFSISTVRNDFLWMQKIKKDDAKDFDDIDYLAGTITNYDDILVKGWEVFNTVTDPEVKLKSLTHIRQTLNDKRKALTELGAVRQQEQKQVIQVNHALVDNWNEGLKDQVSQAIIAAELKTNLLEPVSPKELGIDVDEAELVVDMEKEGD